MEYLDKVLGVKVIYDDVEFKHLPNFIATRYRLQMVSMNEQKMIFLYNDLKDPSVSGFFRFPAKVGDGIPSADSIL
mgnify:FL=1